MWKIAYAAVLDPAIVQARNDRMRGIYPVSSRELPIAAGLIGAGGALGGAVGLTLNRTFNPASVAKGIALGAGAGALGSFLRLAKRKRIDKTAPLLPDAYRQVSDQEKALAIKNDIHTGLGHPLNGYALRLNEAVKSGDPDVLQHNVLSHRFAPDMGMEINKAVFFPFANEMRTEALSSIKKIEQEKIPQLVKQHGIKTDWKPIHQTDEFKVLEHVLSGKPATPDILHKLRSMPLATKDVSQSDANNEAFRMLDAYNKSKPLSKRDPYRSRDEARYRAWIEAAQGAHAKLSDPLLHSMIPTSKHAALATDSVKEKANKLRDILKRGDLIGTDPRATGVGDRLVRFAQGEPYGHTSVYDGNGSVLELQPDQKLKLLSIEDLLKKNQLRVVRLRNKSPEEIDQGVKKMEAGLGEIGYSRAKALISAIPRFGEKGRMLPEELRNTDPVSGDHTCATFIAAAFPHVRFNKSRDIDHTRPVDIIRSPAVKHVISIK